MIGRGLVVDLDDILVYGKTREEHNRRLRATLQRLREQKLFAQKTKCEFLVETVEYLGHIADAAGIRVDPAKVQAVEQWPTPATVRELQSFLGLANYYRKFVLNFAQQAAPLTELLHVNQEWRWASAQEQAFSQLKKALTEAPLLRYPDYTKPFLVTADASDLAVGAVLQQEGDKGRHPTAYFLRKLKGAELNWRPPVRRKRWRRSWLLKSGVVIRRGLNSYWKQTTIP